MNVGGPVLDLLDLVEEFEGLGVAFGEEFFEVALEAEVAAVEHEGVDVAPDLGEVGDIAHLRSNKARAGWECRCGPWRLRCSLALTGSARGRDGSGGSVCGSGGEGGIAGGGVHDFVHDTRPVMASLA
jgi:hypothetical protein